VKAVDRVGGALLNVRPIDREITHGLFSGLAIHCENNSTALSLQPAMS